MMFLWMSMMNDYLYMGVHLLQAYTNQIRH